MGERHISYEEVSYAIQHEDKGSTKSVSRYKATSLGFFNAVLSAWNVYSNFTTFIFVFSQTDKDRYVNLQRSCKFALLTELGVFTFQNQVIVSTFPSNICKDLIFVQHMWTPSPDLCLLINLSYHCVAIAVKSSLTNCKSVVTSVRCYQLFLGLWNLLTGFSHTSLLRRMEVLRAAAT